MNTGSPSAVAELLKGIKGESPVGRFGGRAFDFGNRPRPGVAFRWRLNVGGFCLGIFCPLFLALVCWVTSLLFVSVCLVFLFLLRVVVLVRSCVVLGGIGCVFVRRDW